MTEFTSEWIAEQRRIISSLPKGLEVEEGNNNHTHIVKKFTGSQYWFIDKKITIADVHNHIGLLRYCVPEAIVESCNNYPEALDHIEQLQKRVQELKVRLEASESDLVLYEVSEMLKKTQTRVQELEQERRWIAVSTRLPEIEKDDFSSAWKLVWYMPDWSDDELFLTIACYVKEFNVWTTQYAEKINVFYWNVQNLPTESPHLPQPPKEEE